MSRVGPSNHTSHTVTYFLEFAKFLLPLIKLRLLLVCAGPPWLTEPTGGNGSIYQPCETLFKAAQKIFTKSQNRSSDSRSPDASFQIRIKQECIRNHKYC